MTNISMYNNGDADIITRAANEPNRVEYFQARAGTRLI